MLFLCHIMCVVVFFFFQEKDGIRSVTGVQPVPLPICGMLVILRETQQETAYEKPQEVSRIPQNRRAAGKGKGENFGGGGTLKKKKTK